MDPQTGNNNQLLTNGQDTWSARCGESRTPGAGGDLRETTGGNTGTYPTGIKYTKKQVDALPITRHNFHGEWNYTVAHSPSDTPTST